MQQSTLGSNVSGGNMRDSASNVSEKAHAGIDKVCELKVRIVAAL